MNAEEKIGGHKLNYSEVLQKYLLRIARGELLETSSVLPLVKAAKIFLPQIKNSDHDGIVKVTLPLINKDGQKYLPIYLSRSNSLSYSGTMTNLRDQLNDPVEIKGDTLFQVLPNGYGIIIEPSSSLEVIFTQNKIQNFIHPDGIEVSEQEEQTNKQETTEIPDLQVISGGKDSSSNGTQIKPLSTIEKELENELDPITSKFQIYTLEKDLSEILDSFNSVSEAYILEHNSPHSEIILGLLAKNGTGDERFRVIESVALLSKQIFGYAGAIEVYDDLHDTHSSSWDLFKMIPPFFTKQDLKETLNEQLEITSEKRGIRGSMSRLSRSGLKLFSSSSDTNDN